MHGTIHTVTVHFEHKASEKVEVLEGESGHPEDIGYIAWQKAELIDLEPGQTADDRPSPTHVEYEGKREIEP